MLSRLSLGSTATALLASTLSTLLCDEAKAQRDEGPMLGLPVAFSVDGMGPAPGGGPAAPSTLYAKKGGHIGTDAEANVPSPLPGRPDFRFSEILRHVSQTDPAGNPIYPEIDAFSIGLDVIPTSVLDGETVIDFSGSWGALSFTVLQDEELVGVGPAILAEKVNGTDGAGADVFSYVLESSDPALISEEFQGVTQRVLNGADTGFATAPGQRNQIVSVDAHVPLYDLSFPVINDLPGFDPVGPPLTAYFSVTNASRFNLITGISGGPGRSGATIYTVVWDPTLGIWQPGAPLVTYTDLGFATPTEAEIDAIAYDEFRSRLIFSLSRATTPVGWSQLLTTAVPASLTAGRPAGLLGGPTLAVENLKENDDGEKVLVAGVEDDGMGGSSSGTIRIGVSGDITGVCEKDPTGPNQPGQVPANPIYPGRYAWGTPQTWVFPPALLSAAGLTSGQLLDLSIFRDCKPNTNPVLGLHVTAPGPLPFATIAVNVTDMVTNLGPDFVLFGPLAALYLPVPNQQDIGRLTTEFDLPTNGMIFGVRFYFAAISIAPIPPQVRHSPVVTIDA